jgi:hypothetical protein
MVLPASTSTRPDASTIENFEGGPRQETPTCAGLAPHSGPGDQNHSPYELIAIALDRAAELWRQSGDVRALRAALLDVLLQLEE